MGHELRTPINHIIGFTELVVDENFGKVNDIQKEYLSDVLYSSKHLLSLVNDVLDLSKVEAGKFELELSDIAFKEVMERSLIMIKEKALKKNLHTSLEVRNIPEIIRADNQKLKQILYDLLANAIKYTPDS